MSYLEGKIMDSWNLPLLHDSILEFMAWFSKIKGSKSFQLHDLIFIPPYSWGWEDLEYHLDLT